MLLAKVNGREVFLPQFRDVVMVKPSKIEDQKTRMLK
jgi:hypothetical protein